MLLIKLGTGCGDPVLEVDGLPVGGADARPLEFK